MIDFEENPDDQILLHYWIIKNMHEMDLQRVTDTIDCMLRRLVEMER